MEKLELAWKMYDEGRYAASEALYEESLHESGAKARSSVMMGLVYVKCALKKFDEARVYGHTLLKIAEEGNELDLHIALHQNGMIERMAENYDRALQIFLKEAQIIHRDYPDDSMRIAANLYEQAYVLHRQFLHEKALTLMERSLQHALKSADPTTIACSYRGMGEIEKALGHSEKAIGYLQQSLKAFKQTNDVIGIEEVENMLAGL